MRSRVAPWKEYPSAGGGAIEAIRDAACMRASTRGHGLVVGEPAPLGGVGDGDLAAGAIRHGPVTATQGHLEPGDDRAITAAGIESGGMLQEGEEDVLEEVVATIITCQRSRVTLQPTPDRPEKAIA
ncbi:MAG: hypothetical protein R3F39_05880 [Myxococcota bacterium]